MWPPRLDLCTRLAWLVLIVLGCGSPTDVADNGGQTGSAACGTSPRCICDSVADAEVVRGVFTSNGDSQASIEVLEVFGSSDTSVGDTWVGPHQVGFPCGLGTLQPVADGTEVLAALPPGAGALPPNMYVVPWAPTLQLTPDFTLDASDASILVDAAACGRQFPDEEVVCKDNF